MVHEPHNTYVLRTVPATLRSIGDIQAKMTENDAKVDQNCDSNDKDIMKS